MNALETRILVNEVKEKQIKESKESFEKWKKDQEYYQDNIIPGLIKGKLEEIYKEIKILASKGIESCTLEFEPRDRKLLHAVRENLQQNQFKTFYYDVGEFAMMNLFIEW